MSKFLKKKIKHTLPIIFVFCLFNVLVLALSFNLNLNFVKQPTQAGFVNLASNAEASTASTTVTVRNSPPIFTAGPTENPTSTSTTPINVGGNIGFTGTASDPEGDSYWLIICSGNKAATTTGAYDAPPTCAVGVQFCISNLASSTVGVSCTYNNITDPGSETQPWYAFVCDNHVNDGRCSPLNQGSGVGGSPFYVNHAPHINKVKTTIDHQNPGQSVTITATTTDYDHAVGHYNIESLYICNTASWTAAAGCGGLQLCHGSSTVTTFASTSASCTYSIPIPTNHSAFSYYAYVKDYPYEMPANMNQGTSSTYNVNNVAPVVTNVTLDQGNDIFLNIKNAAQVLVKASSTSVTDNNGCTDLSSATSSMYLLTKGNNCVGDPNNCYQIGNGNCAISNCSGPSSITATVICSTTFAFYAMPTDSFSKASTTSWRAGIKVADSLGLKGLGTTTSGIAVRSDNALSLYEASIPYGTVQAGTNTGSLDATTTVVNYGNTPIDSAVSGTDMLKNKVGPQLIKVSNQQHSKLSFTFTAGNTSSTTPDTVTIGIPRPTSNTDVIGKIMWGINVPLGVPSASFYGVNTFTSVANKYDNWNYP